MTDIPAGYKQTEIGIIPNDWNVSNITNSFSMKARIGWQGLRTDEYLNNGNYYLITGQDFDNGKIGWDNCYYVDKKRYDQDKHIQIKPLDVLVTKDGTIGKVAFIDSITKPATLNSGVFVLRTKNDSVYQKFFYYLLSSFYFDNFMSQITAGSTIVHLYQKDFVKFDHIVPSYKEQKEIANTLSDMDELISNLDKLIYKKHNIKRGVMQELLSGRKRLSGFVGEWKEIKVKDIFTVTRGQVLAMGKLSDTCSSRFPYPVYSSQTTNHGIAGYYDDFLFENCITRTTDGANAGDVNYRDGKFYCTNVCGVLKSDKGYANGCIAGIIGSCSKSYVSYVGNPKLMNNVMAEIPINIPPTIEEQLAISKILSDIDKEIEALEQKKTKYENLKIGAIQKLLTGKIRLV